MDNEPLKRAVKNYRPGADVISQLTNTDLIAVVGASASGKTTIIERAAEKSKALKMVGNETSRVRRPGEKEGLEYRFVSQESMIKSMKKGEYVQVALGRTGQLSATRPSDYPSRGTGLIAIWSSAVPVFRGLFPKMRTVFIVPESFEKWTRWFVERTKDISEEEKARRLAEAKISYEFALKDPGTVFILNDKLDKAAGRLLQAASGQKPANEDRARQIAKINYTRLQEL